MFARRSSALAALAAVFVLSGCTGGIPVSATSPIVSGTAAPSAATSPTENPLADEPKPTPSGAPVEQTNTPPAEWTNDELIGACKVEWNRAGSVDWSSFSPDALVEPRGDSYYVAFQSTATNEVRDCKISGSPSSPQVKIGS